MNKHTITYTDYNGVKRTDDFYFNLSQYDVIKLDETYPEGFQKAYDDAVESNDTRKITRIFLDMIMRAYGKKSADGMHFQKSEELSEDFVSGPAFDALLAELTSDRKVMEDFFFQTISQDIRNRAALNAAAPLA